MFDGQFTTEASDWAFPELWDGCIGAWCPSLGVQGSAVYDWSVYQNTAFANVGSATFPTWTSDTGQSCLSIASVTLNGLAVANGAYLNQPAISVSAWIKSSAYNSPGSILCRDDSSVTNQRVFQFRMSGSVMQFIGFNSGGTPSTINGITTLGTGWYHVVATVSAAGFLTLYLNGFVDNSASLTTGALVTSQTPTTMIGNYRAGTASQSLGGLIDDVRYYNREITAGEALKLYNNGYGRGIAYTPSSQRGLGQSIASIINGNFFALMAG